jgi:hypothetical protein
MNRAEPAKSEIWRHFKGNYHKIICIGHHSETGEKMVVYARVTPVYENTDDGYVVMDEPCIRPLDMFMSEVDRVKYPDVKQKYRFERVEKIIPKCVNTIT